jgi:hypothetical protein
MSIAAQAGGDGAERVTLRLRHDRHRDGGMGWFTETPH